MMSQSMYAPGSSANRKSVERDVTDSNLKKRTSSAHGLDRSGEGKRSSLVEAFPRNECRVRFADLVSSRLF